MKVIGQTREVYKDYQYSSLMDLVGQPISEKEQVVDYMKRSKVLAVAPAALRDVINPERRIPELFLMSDGEYEWRSDVIYYVEKYDMALPAEFIQHVLIQIAERKKKKTTIGQTRETHKNNMYPPIAEMINKPIKEKQYIVEYMKRSKTVAKAHVVARDVINPENEIDVYLMSDGKYEWRSDVIYYVDKYNMQLPDEFIEYALSQQE